MSPYTLRPIHNMLLYGVLGAKLNATYCICAVYLLTKCLFTFFCPFIDRQVFFKSGCHMGCYLKRMFIIFFTAAFRELDKA